MLFVLIMISIHFALGSAEHESCKNGFRAQLLEIVESDNNQIISLQFKLTMLKLAKKLNNENLGTLEEHVKRDTARLEKLNTATPDTMKKLTDLYDQNATPQITKVYNHVEEMKEKSRQANYWKANQRLMNEDVSAYLLFDQLANPSSEFSKMDVAITWYMQKVSEEAEKASGKFSANHNLTNISNQVIRYRGVLKGTEIESRDDLNKGIDQTQKSINSFLKNAATTIQNNMASCFEGPNAWMKSCDLTNEFLDKEIQELLMSLSETGSKLNKDVSKSILSVTKKNVEGYKASVESSTQNEKTSIGKNITSTLKKDVTSTKKTEDEKHILRAEKPYSYDEQIKLNEYLEFRKTGKCKVGVAFMKPEYCVNYHKNEILLEKQYGLNELYKMRKNAKNYDVKNEVTQQVDELVSSEGKRKITVQCSSTGHVYTYDLVYRDGLEAGTNGALDVLTDGNFGGDEGSARMVIRQGNGAPKLVGLAFSDLNQVKRCTKAYLWRHCDMEGYKKLNCD